MSTLRHDRNILAYITHTQFLKAILDAVQAKNFFAAQDAFLRVEIDTIADEVLRKLAEQQFASPILTNASGMRTATINFNDKTAREFTQLLTQIQRAIQSQFEKEMER